MHLALHQVSGIIMVLSLCSALGLKNPGRHAFRRGMATDYLSVGKPISYILRAGGWKSSSALLYLANSELDKR